MGKTSIVNNQGNLLANISTNRKLYLIKDMKALNKVNDSLSGNAVLITVVGPSFKINTR
jgi:hypothetical protein